jgi:hypothetical protein
MESDRLRAIAADYQQRHRPPTSSRPTTPFMDGWRVAPIDVI